MNPFRIIDHADEIRRDENIADIQAEIADLEKQLETLDPQSKDYKKIEARIARLQPLTKKYT